MQTVSSASSTCFRLVSAVECTATVLMPISRQARSILSAISPRLAMRIFSIMRVRSGACALVDYEQHLAVFHRLAVLGPDRLHHAVRVGLDRVHHLHRLDDAQGVAGLHPVADLYERAGAG